MEAKPQQAQAPSLATGAPLTAETWADFRRRLHHDCVGEGVAWHFTADAIFIVQARRFIFGIDHDYTDQLAVILDGRHWFSPHEYWDDLDEEERASLDAQAIEEQECKFLELDPFYQWAILRELDDHTVAGWDERWEFVCANHTHDGAEAFIARKKHDYRDGLRIYVEAQPYCWEFNAIKQAILDGRLQFIESTPSAAPDPMLVLTDRDLLTAAQAWREFDAPEGIAVGDAVGRMMYGAMRSALNLYRDALAAAKRPESSL